MNYYFRIGLAVSTMMFVIGIVFLFGVMPLLIVISTFDDDYGIDPDKMLALLPLSITLMFFGGVGMSTFSQGQ